MFPLRGWIFNVFVTGNLNRCNHKKFAITPNVKPKGELINPWHLLRVAFLLVQRSRIKLH